MWLLDRFAEYAGPEWRAVQQAPIAFIVCLCVIAAGMWVVFNWAYGSVISQKNAIIENQKTRVDGLEAKIKELQQSAAIPSQPSPLAPIRNPDGIYQFGAQVGEVRSAQVDESTGSVTFGSIIGTITFNAERDFEYRDFILHVKSYAAEMRASIAGQTGRALNQVTCEIVGRVPHQ
jgi:hypothetical protein